MKDPRGKGFRGTAGSVAKDLFAARATVSALGGRPLVDLATEGARNLGLISSSDRACSYCSSSAEPRRHAPDSDLEARPFDFGMWSVWWVMKYWLGRVSEVKMKIC